MKLHAIAVMLPSFALCACTSTGILQADKPGMNIGGTLARGAFEPYRVEVALDGKAYRGEWRTGAPTREQLAATGYPHRRHVGVVQSRLVAADGSALDCRWETHGDRAEGKCVSNDREYPLSLK